MSDCGRCHALLDAHIDGELSPELALEVESHLERCPRCADELSFTDAVRTTLAREVTAAAIPSEGFEARLRQALAAAEPDVNAVTAPQPVEAAVPVAPRPRRRSPQPEAPRTTWGAPWLWAALAAAAAVPATVSFQSTPLAGAIAGVTLPASPPSELSFTATIDALLDELIEHHVNPMDPQVIEPALVSELTPRVGVPVRLPALDRYGARWEGGSIVPVQTERRRAASLRYRLGDEAITVYVYDASRMPLRARLEPVVVHGMPVYVGSRRGLNIAAAERHGMGYAVASELSDTENAELVVATAPPALQDGTVVH